jgi:signal transduction histidine kinase
MTDRIDARLAALLKERSDEITARWHGELHRRLGLRPHNVFPGAALLDGMPSMVEWLTGSLADHRGPGQVNEASLRHVAEHWRGAGFSIEEALLHFRMLADLLFEALTGLVDEPGVDAAPAECVRAAARVCHAVDVAQVILVATYRDAEEERITAFGETLAHEVRDQLGASLTAIQVVRTLRGDEDVQWDPAQEDELLEGAEQALEKANELVSAVRTLSETGVDPGGDWAMRPLGLLVADIVGDLDAKAGRDVHLRVDDGMPESPVPRDPVSLILYNLVENGIKYSDPDKGERWVRIQGHREDDGHLVVQVGDNGLGISEAEQERVFNRFHRGARRHGDGFGLGLSIARRAARSIGGRLMLESEPGRGSTFGFTIPLESQGAVRGTDDEASA